MNTGTTTANFNQWNEPNFIRVEEVGETIEFIYKHTSMIRYTVYPQRPPEERVFIIVYSCKDGKWNKSEPIYGNIIPATYEDYDFD